jgi:hypothetical protein
MPCLFVAIALIVPRLTIFILWFFTTWFTGIFTSLLWPILGFIFAPTSLLWYSVVQNVFDGAWGPIPIIGMVIAVMIDLSPSTGTRNRQRD